MKQHKIPCPSPHPEEHSDYHPLSKPEIAELLSIASHAGRHEANSVLCRLDQGIVGIQCPREIEGAAAEREDLLNKLFVGNYRKGPTPELIDQLYALMRGE